MKLSGLVERMLFIPEKVYIQLLDLCQTLHTKKTLCPQMKGRQMKENSSDIVHPRHVRVFLPLTF